MAVDATTFLRAVFHSLAPGEAITYSTQRRKETGGISMPSRILHPDPGAIVAGSATHFCPCSFDASAAKGSRIVRTSANAMRMHAVLSDDVGTKARAIGLDPSWVMETKPGNYQMGYILHEPTSFEVGDALLFTMGEAGFTDRGSAKANQVFRLPGSQPPGKPHKAVLIAWNPERRYTLAEVTEQLGRVVEARRDRRGEGGPSVPDGMVIDDPFTTWVRSQDWYIGDVGASGFESIVCPWADTHTDGNEEAGYHAPTHENAARAFNCFHGHCADRTSAQFIAWCVAQGAPDLGTVFEVVRDHTELASLMRLDVAQVAAVRQIYAAHPEAEAPPTDTGPVSRLVAAILERFPDPAMPMRLYRETRRGAIYEASVSNIEDFLTATGIVRTYDLITRRYGWSLPDWLADAGKDMNDAQITSALKDLMVYAIVKEAARGRVEEIRAEMVSPAAEYLQSLPEWDGEDHIAAFCDSIPAEDPGLCRLIFKKFLIQMVQAAHNHIGEPEQVGFVPVLIGKQGVGKTRLVKGLVPPGMFRLDIALRFGGQENQNRDAALKALGCWLGELGELGTTTRNADMNALKGFLTRTEDTFYLKYDKYEVTTPRSTCWIATANDSVVLHDASGDRRFGVLYLKAGVRLPFAGPATRNRIWAQAYALWKAKPTSYLLSDEEQARIAEGNSQAREHDAVAEAMEELYGPGPFDDLHAQPNWAPTIMRTIVRALYRDEGNLLLLGGMPKQMLTGRVADWLTARGARRAKRDVPGAVPVGGKRARLSDAYLLPVPGAVSGASGTVADFTSKLKPDPTS